jgi:histone-lysine N-methyltransferase EZH2
MATSPASDFLDLSESDDEGGLERGDRALVSKVYKRVWNEFYAWEQDHCRQLIDTELTATTTFSDAKTPPFALLGFVHEISSSVVEHMDVDVEASNPESFTIWQYWPTREPPSTRARISCEVITAGYFPPHPQYEACTPASRNIAPLPHETDESQVLEFLPYSDDPTLDFIPFVRHFPQIAWQDNWDPDCNCFASLHALD